MSRPFSQIDWSGVLLPPNTTRQDIEREYEESMKDIAKLNQEFERYFRNKRRKSHHALMTDDIFSAVWENVRYLPSGEIDVEPISKLVMNEDRELYKDVVNFVFQLYKGKPRTFFVLARFKIMLTYYLCVVGF